MKLKFDPYAVFRRSRTPAGLYARRKWLREQGDPGYRREYEKTVRHLLAGQSADGSWEQSFVKTIRRLVGLHLTVRDEIEPVRIAIEWLQDRVRTFFQRQKILLAEKPSRSELAGLPFTRSAPVLLLTAGTLFLASVFGLGEDPAILNLYERLRAAGSKGTGKWCGWSSYSNILRAFVVHPRYVRSEAVALAVRNLGKVQKESGTWAEPIPFFQTVNALAHLDSGEADAQLARAFERLHRTQRPDGTWSRSQPEWHTFLVIHALKNKGEL